MGNFNNKLNPQGYNLGGTPTNDNPFFGYDGSGGGDVNIEMVVNPGHLSQPVVTKTTTDGVTTFTIDGLQGEDGADGKTPNVNITATVNDGTVAVTKAGTAANPNFNFDFDIHGGGSGASGGILTGRFSVYPTMGNSPSNGNLITALTSYLQAYIEQTRPSSTTTQIKRSDTQVGIFGSFDGAGIYAGQNGFGNMVSATLTDSDYTVDDHPDLGYMSNFTLTNSAYKDPRWELMFTFSDDNGNSTSRFYYYVTDLPDRIDYPVGMTQLTEVTIFFLSGDVLTVSRSIHTASGEVIGATSSTENIPFGGPFAGYMSYTQSGDDTVSNRAHLELECKYIGESMLRLTNGFQKLVINGTWVIDETAGVVFTLSNVNLVICTYGVAEGLSGDKYVGECVTDVSAIIFAERLETILFGFNGTAKNLDIHTIYGQPA